MQELTDKIEELLDTGGCLGGPFQWVSDGEANTATEEITQHDSETANAIFYELEDRVLSEELIQQLYDGSTPSSQNDTQSINDFASKLSGENLVVLSDGLEKYGDYLSQYNREDQLADAMAEHATDKNHIESKDCRTSSY